MFSCIVLTHARLTAAQVLYSLKIDQIPTLCIRGGYTILHYVYLRILAIYEHTDYRQVKYLGSYIST